MTRRPQRPLSAFVAGYPGRGFGLPFGRQTLGTTPHSAGSWPFLPNHLNHLLVATVS